jgi:hypothetical protein
MAVTIITVFKNSDKDSKKAGNILASVSLCEFSVSLCETKEELTQSSTEEAQSSTENLTLKMNIFA